MSEEQKTNTSGKKAGDVHAESVTVRQGGVINVDAEKLEVRQGGIVNASARSLELTGGGILLSQAENTRIFASRSGVVIAKHDAALDQSGTLVQIARGDVTMEQSGTVFQVANNIKMGDNNGTVFLFAKNIEGDIHSAFGQKESLAFAVVAGITTGLVLLGGMLLGRKKK